MSHPFLYLNRSVWLTTTLSASRTSPSANTASAPVASPATLRTGRTGGHPTSGSSASTSSPRTRSSCSSPSPTPSGIPSGPGATPPCRRTLRYKQTDRQTGRNVAHQAKLELVSEVVLDGFRYRSNEWMNGYIVMSNDGFFSCNWFLFFLFSYFVNRSVCVCVWRYQLWEDLWII